MNFDLNRLNKHLRKQHATFRLVWQADMAGDVNLEKGGWCALNGLFLIQGFAFTVWVSNNLCRYLRGPNGQMWRCTDVDLKSMSEAAQRQYKFNLTDLAG